MTRPGRPRQNRELDEARARMKAERAWLVLTIRRVVERKGLTGKDCARVAASLLFTLEHGTEYQKARCQRRIRELNDWARANGPHGRWSNDREFLEHFVREHAPGWKWRECINDGTRVRRNERNVKEIAESARFCKAIRTRFVTPDAPDSGGLLRFRRIRPSDPSTWPTVRELKLATAIPERVIQKIVATLRPLESEIVTIPLRHSFSRRGAVPKRYHPRFVLAVLDLFVSCLPAYSVKNEELKRLHQSAMKVKRALMLKLRASGSNT